MTNDARAGVCSDDAETLRQIFIASGALTHALGQALADPPTAGLSSNADVAVLSALHLTGPQRPRELRDRAGLTAGGLSNLFDRLEGLQLITRTYGVADDDRRSTLVSLTTGGRHVAEAIADATRRTTAEQSALLRHICHLIDSISDPSPSSPALEPALTPLEQIGRLVRVGIDLGAAMADRRPDEPTPANATLVLCAAATPDGTRPRELLDLTDLSSGSVTMLLDRLEDAGLIRRAGGLPPDRRAVTVTVTDLGHRVLRDCLERTVDLLPQIRSAVAVPDLGSAMCAPGDPRRA